MKNALRVSDLIQKETESKGKGIEFTHELTTKSGWEHTQDTPQHEDITNIVYLGKCGVDGDMFCVYAKHINIFKGHLNDGTY